MKDKIFENCLTEEQTRYVYDTVESGNEIQVRKDVVRENILLPNVKRGKMDINLYEKVLVGDIKTMNKNISQMEQWSILSNNIVYVKLVSNDVYNGVDVKMVDYREHKRMFRRMGREEGGKMNIDFGESLTRF